MERLTFEGNFCDIAKCEFIPGGSFCENGACSQRKVWERLKAYEDTGLTPDEIRSMQDEHFSGLEMAKLHSALMELKKYQEADKDGRLVVLPCKVGDAVYILRRTFDGADVVGEAELWWDDIPQLGKTVFLTREEAEKALEATKDD